MTRVRCLTVCIAFLSLLWACENPTQDSAAASSDKEISSFAFLTVDNPFLDEQWLGFVDQDNSTIYLATSCPLPLNDLPPLIARFTTSGVSVKWNTTAVISGATPLRYLPWPVLTVVAEDGTTCNYTVQVRQLRLDAFVANYNEANRVWVNGGGTFTDSGQALGSSNSYDVALGDLDGDGDLDAFVANVSEANRVWENDGSGTFTDSGQALGSSESLGVALGDLNGR